MTQPNDLQNLPPLDLIRELRKAGRAAEACVLGARLSASGDPGCHVGQLGIDLSFLGMHAEAEKHLKRALGDQSLGLVDRYKLTEELCIVQFVLGKFHEAHEHYRAIRGRSFADAFRYAILSDDPMWDAALPHKLLEMHEPVAGKHIFILAEGGFGDFVMFSRYIDVLLREGARSIVIEQFPGWEEIFRESEQVTLSLATAEERAVGLERCDRVTMGFGLYARYQRSPYFPVEDPGARIAIGPQKRLPDAASALIDAETRRLNVGLIWKSASGARQEPYRSMPLARLESVLGHTGCRFHSLQVGDLTDEERAVMDRHDMIDLAPHLHTFGDTARVLERLDLLITIDTGTAHLAGALNRPVWTLLSQACDSRWLDCQRFTPWYPSMRLYRQTVLGDWTQPLADLQSDLVALNASSRRVPAESP